MGVIADIAMLAVWCFLLVYCVTLVGKYAAKGQDDPLSVKVDPTVHLEKSLKQTGCLADLESIFYMVLLLALFYFVVFYVLPYIGPVIRFARDLK